MIRWRDGTVTGLRRRWHGAVELDVTVAGRTVPALAYPALVGEPEPGDRVLLNVGALALGLGTGGYAMVVALPDRLPPDPPGGARPHGGAAGEAPDPPVPAHGVGGGEQAPPPHPPPAPG